MKNIFKYSAAVALMVLGFASCEEMPDYQTTIDAAPDFIYVNPQGGDIFSAVVVHRPEGSAGSYTAEFQVKYNTTKHEEVTASVVYAPDLVAEYNLKNGTSYAVLAKEYFTLENDTVTVPADTTASRDTVRIILNESADLAALTEPAYLAPFTVTSNGAEVSENLGTVWFAVNTEVNILRKITSANEVEGMPAGETVLWSADCNDFANLFDGNTSTTVSFAYNADNELIVDMKNVNKVTGLKLNTYNINNVGIEYSENGETWKQAGRPSAGEYVFSGSNSATGTWCVALAEAVSARYIKLSFRMANSRYLTMNGVEVFINEGNGPVVYAAAGSNNVLTGKVTHKAGTDSKASFSASFPAYVTASSQSGYTVTAANDESLVAAYNQKYGTSYAALPAENLDITTASVTVPAGETVSSESFAVALKGDVNSLTDSEGYLAALKLSASGTTSSASRGVVYVLIKPERNVIKDLNYASDIIGFQASRTGWTATANGSNTANLFDGSTSTRVNFNASNNVLVVNMGGVHNVTGLNLYGYQLSNIGVEYSLDGSEWVSAGVAESNEIIVPSSNRSQGNNYIGFTEPLEAAQLRVTFNCNGTSSSYRRVVEFYVYEVDGTDPAVYTIAGTDNVFTGKITHHVTAGSFGSASASFNAMVTHASDAGYDVVAVVDNSYINEYNAAHGTSYVAIDPANVEITGMVTRIEAGAMQSTGTVTVSLKGDIAELTDKNGYLIPVKLATSGAVTSAKRGVVYLAVNVVESDAVLMDGFSSASIAGSIVEDRSGWSILECDEGGVYDPATTGYSNLFDGDTKTYIRTWGGPVSFTVDLGKEYDMTGIMITARTDNSSYATYQPTSVMIMTSLDNASFTDLGTATKTDGTIVSANPSSWVAFYAPQKVRYLKIEAGYGSNMGTAEFNIYAK